MAKTLHGPGTAIASWLPNSLNSNIMVSVAEERHKI